MRRLVKVLILVLLPLALAYAAWPIYSALEIREAVIARIPQRRLGTPRDVAEVVAFLARRASYINGTVIHVNGGLFGG